jgi:hypothetical protein
VSKIEKLMVELDETGLREFQSEMLDAVYASDGDERFARILRAWHSSLRFLAEPGFRDKLASSQQEIHALTGD